MSQILGRKKIIGQKTAGGQYKVFSSTPDWNFCFIKFLLSFNLHENIINSNATLMKKTPTGALHQLSHLLLCQRRIFSLNCGHQKPMSTKNPCYQKNFANQNNCFLQKEIKSYFQVLHRVPNYYASFNFLESTTIKDHKSTFILIAFF